MRISTKGHYGLRSLIDIAVNQQDGPVTLSEIAKRQSISVKYLWQVINPLRMAGFLSVTRGAKGGYLLARPPEAINMLDVLTTLEGPVSIIGCLADPSACSKVQACAARSVWSDVNQAAEGALARITLAAVLSQYARTAEASSYAI